MQLPKNIGIIYGGKSVEHEVSIVTGLQIYENIDKSKYNAILIYIDKYGNWWHGKKLSDISVYKSKSHKFGKQFFPSLNLKDKKNILLQLDVAVIASHGNYGEDGRLQGLLDFCNIPYTSSGVVGSASGMDKIVMKNIFMGLDIPVLPYVWFTKEQWAENEDEVINKVHYTLDYPVFVKPANLGSSIGISMANSEKDLKNAISIALQYDRRIIVEKGVEKSVEVNCSALSRDGEIITSVIEEPVHWEEFLSFQDKYIRSNSKGKTGMSDMARKIPADISSYIEDHIKKYAQEIYKAMDCSGVVRIDFLLNSDRSKLYVNEINTIPGSLSFYLWEHNNIKFSELIDILINEAIKFYNLKNDKIFMYDSDILNNIGKGAKNKVKG